MSGDEVFVLIVSCIIAAIAWGTWFRDSLLFNSFTPWARASVRCFLTPLLCAAILLSILRQWSAQDVRNSVPYLIFYFVFGTAWLGLVQRVFTFGGINARDDVFERRNRAAATAWRGSMVGLTLCFAGGNIGDGPGWWVVLFSALLATGALFALWLTLDRLTGIVDSITINRNSSAGLRAAGFFVATGLVLGRAVAGNWSSAAMTMVDFVKLGWPAAILLLVATVFEFACRTAPTRRPELTLIHGWFPAIILVVLGALSVFVLGGRL
jgi:hypothetical protein